MIELTKATELVKKTGFNNLASCEEYESFFLFITGPLNKEDMLSRSISISVAKEDGTITYPDFITVITNKEKPIRVINFQTPD